jgi:hypothetical protein
MGHAEAPGEPQLAPAARHSRKMRSTLHLLTPPHGPSAPHGAPRGIDPHGLLLGGLVSREGVLRGTRELHSRVLEAFRVCRGLAPQYSYGSASIAPQWGWVVHPPTSLSWELSQEGAPQVGPSRVARPGQQDFILSSQDAKAVWWEIEVPPSRVRPRIRPS